ncbi:MAG: arsenite methyltransferase [Candidatus Rokubacteria bacterium]|nr:arsenite methyltransferase [Candidatus Rokubacteria bacterium]
MDIKRVVLDKYGEIARRVAEGATAECGTAAGRGRCDPITSDLYSATEAAEVPGAALSASRGCGNPTALAALSPGEVVLDLGSGGGVDVLLSARRVGPSGKAYGLDMTDEMLALARANAARAGVTNAEFLKGEIEAIPLPAASVDVVISNCVINLSTDKDRVLAEAFRVLKPGGRFAVSDVVVRGAIPADLRRSVELWIGCVAGALDEADYRTKLARAGFTDIDIEPTRVYRAADARELLSAEGIDADAVAPLVDGKVMSAFVRARKPGGKIMSVPRVHVHMSVSDLAKSTEFYTKFFGVAPVKQKPGYAKFLPEFGPLNLALSAHEGAGSGGHVDHMGVQVATREDVLRELARVKAAGLAVREEIGVDCCHANQDKFWVKDPDGVEWEVYVLNYDLDDTPGLTATVQRDAGTGVAIARGPVPFNRSCCSPS